MRGLKAHHAPRDSGFEMRFQLLQLPKLLRQRQSTAVFGIIIIAMVWIGVAAKYWEGYSNDRRESERLISNFAMLFEENVLRSIGEIDKALLYLRQTVESKEWENYQLAVMSNDVLSEIIVQVAIIDAHGIMRASSAITQPIIKPIDLSDREHYRAHLGNKDDKLYISRPVLGRASNKWSVQFTRRFLNPDGSFGGVVVASLNPTHFAGFYEKIDLGSSTSISMIGADGVVRSSGGDPDGKLELGVDISGTTVGRRMQAGQSVIFEDAETFRDDTRLVALRNVRDQPLWVTVSVDQNEVFARSWSNLQALSAAGILLTILILGAMERVLRSEASAKLKAEQLRLTLEHMSQGIMLVTREQDVPIINGRCGDLLGLPADYIARPPRFDKIVEHQARTSGDQDDDVGLFAGRLPPAAEAADVPSSPRDMSVCERKLPNGTIVEVRTTHLPDGSFVQTFSDVTQRCEAEAHVARLASEDPLTGLPNRRVFRSLLDQLCIAPTGQPGSPAAPSSAVAPKPFAVLFLDLDRFKIVNDTLGHRVGDLLLLKVAERLKARLEAGQSLARLGGDEFALVVTEDVSRARLTSLANALSVAVCEPFEIDTHQIRTSVSIGIAVAPDDGRTADDLLMASDLALYSVKANGRGTHRFFDRSMNEEAKVRRQIESDLRDAIERESFELHYQPILDVRRNSITGFEALVRWRHPEKGLIPPSVFIPIAEETGLIVPIDDWVLREACRTALEWPDRIKVAINLSAVQFTVPDLPERVEAILRTTGLPPERLEVEITESVFLDKTDSTLATLHRLKEIGIRVAMDDFGTGYSSLSYLQSFPFDKIKVDRSFVAELGPETKHLVIIQAIVSIARALSMTTTAEGVETPSQLKFVEALGCNEFQGYLASAPVTKDKIPAMIAGGVSMKASIAA
jgi:diguanylate cyclase (GGDEF)-like protein